MAKQKRQKSPQELLPADPIATIVIQANMRTKQVSDWVLGNNVTIDDALSIAEYYANKLRNAQVEFLKQQAQQNPPQGDIQPDIEHSHEDAPEVSEAHP